MWLGSKGVGCAVQCGLTHMHEYVGCTPVDSSCVSALSYDINCIVLNKLDSEY